MTISYGFYQICDSPDIGDCDDTKKAVYYVTVWGTGPCVNGQPSGTVQWGYSCVQPACGGMLCP